MKSELSTPDAFDSLAAICKFIAVPKIEPNFHRRHYHAIEMADAFIRVLASKHEPLKKVLQSTLPLPVSESAQALREVVPAIGLDEKQVQWLDAQMTEILKVLVPVVRDPDLPSWLSSCRNPFEQAFY